MISTPLQGIDKLTLGHVPSLVEGEGLVVFDVGASVGTYLLGLLAAAGPGRVSEVHAFEPREDACEELRKRFPDAKVNCLGVASSEGDRDFFEFREGQLSCLYDRKHFAGSAPTRPLRCVTLDGYCEAAGVERIDYLKIDVEGAELEVLRGAGRMLSQGRIEAGQFEYGGCYEDSGATLSSVKYYLNQMGYDVWEVGPELTPLREVVEDYRYTNFVFRRRRPLSVLVFSKDRPFFLDAYLRSLEGCGLDLTVLWKASDPRFDYAGVKAEHPGVRFEEQTERFQTKQFILGWLDEATDVVMMTVDDNICAGPFDVQAIREAMEDSAVFGFTLRLSPGVNRSQSGSFSPETPEGSGVIVYDPSDYEGPWAYVWEMSSTFYRRCAVREVVEAGNPSNPNDLENDGLKLYNAGNVGRMACFGYAPVTNIFVDSWLSPQHVAEQVSDDDALELRRAGRRVDVARTFAERDALGVTHVKRLFLTDERRLTNSAVVVIPAWNAEPWIEKCVRSVLGQTYQDIGIVFVDDASDDRTFELGSRLLEGVRDAVVHRNDERSYVLSNMYFAVRRCCANPESVIFTVDGDDWLTEPTAVEEMMGQHRTADVVWSMYEDGEGRDCPNGMLPEGVPVRKAKWLSSHFRSYKKFLFDAIREEDFFDQDGEMFKMACDQAQMLHALEMCPRRRWRFYPKVLYHYNRETTLNNDKVNHPYQMGCADRLRARPPYAVLGRYREATGGLDIRVVVMSHNTPDTATELWRRLSGEFDVTVIDSGSDPDKRPDCRHLDFPNLYWTGCWNKALEMFGDSDVLWVLGGDVELRSDPAEYRRAIEDCWPFGAWSPGIEGRCRPMMMRSHAEEVPAVMHQVEGIAFAVDTRFLKGLGGFPKELRLGWGCDVWFCWKAREAGRQLVLDGRVGLRHPPEQGYETNEAMAEFRAFFAKEVGGEWWKAVHHESDTFAYQSYGMRITPRVSVVIPCYNQARYLPRCVGSVVGQRTGNVQVVVVNDGSEDDCDEVVEGIRKEFPAVRMTYVKQENRGLPGARNTGFENASSDLVFTLDADDCLMPHTLERCILALGPDDGVAYVDLRNRSGSFQEMNLNLETLPTANSVASCALIRKSVWERLGGYKDEMREGCEDWEFWINCVKNDVRLVKAEGAEVLIDDVHDGRMSPHIRQHHVYLRIRERVRKLHPDFISKVPMLSYGVTQRQPVTVVVSSYNQLSTLPLFLESMEVQTMRPAMVVVADDGSSDGTCDWLDDHAGRYSFPVSYVTRQHGGYRLASLENLGAAGVEDGRVLFTNADVVHSRRSVESHSQASGVGGGVVKGIQRGRSGDVTLEMVRDFGLLLAVHRDAPSPRCNLGYIKQTDPRKDPIGVWGGNFSVPASKFREVGGFDESFSGWGGEDNELVRRLVGAGCEAGWVMDSECYHLDHETRQYASDQEGSRRYARKLMGG